MVKKCILVFGFYNDESVIYKSFPQTWGGGAVSRASFSNCSIKMLATMGLSGLPIAAPSICW